jgi:hypothetical protein
VNDLSSTSYCTAVVIIAGCLVANIYGNHDLIVHPIHELSQQKIIRGSVQATEVSCIKRTGTEKKSN